MNTCDIDQSTRNYLRACACIYFDPSQAVKFPARINGQWWDCVIYPQNKWDIWGRKRGTQGKRVSTMLRVYVK